MADLYPDYKQAIKDVIEEGFYPGKLITHEWLEVHLKLDKSDSNYAFSKLSKVEAFKKELLEDYKIHLQSVRGKGYRVVPPEEQTENAMDITLSGVQKSLRKGMNHLRNVDTKRLNDFKKKENTDAMTRVAAMSSMFRREKKEIKKGGVDLYIQKN